jgi:hypothetical protein
MIILSVHLKDEFTISEGTNEFYFVHTKKKSYCHSSFGIVGILPFAGHNKPMVLFLAAVISDPIIIVSRYSGCRGVLFFSFTETYIPVIYQQTQ